MYRGPYHGPPPGPPQGQFQQPPRGPFQGLRAGSPQGPFHGPRGPRPGSFQGSSRGTPRLFQCALRGLLKGPPRGPFRGSPQKTFQGPRQGPPQGPSTGLLGDSPTDPSVLLRQGPFQGHPPKTFQVPPLGPPQGPSKGLLGDAPAETSVLLPQRQPGPIPCLLGLATAMHSTPLPAPPSRSNFSVRQPVKPQGPHTNTGLLGTPSGQCTQHVQQTQPQTSENHSQGNLVDSLDFEPANNCDTSCYRSRQGKYFETKKSTVQNNSSDFSHDVDLRVKPNNTTDPAVDPFQRHDNTLPDHDLFKKQDVDDRHFYQQQATRNEPDDHAHRNSHNEEGFIRENRQRDVSPPYMSHDSDERHIPPERISPRKAGDHHRYAKIDGLVQDGSNSSALVTAVLHRYV